MTDTNQKLREALQAYQDANEMSPYGDYSKIEWESSAGPVNPSWGGGDCKKHGRWYGRCYSCSDEWDNLRKMADRDAYTARENALNAAKQMARQALALPTAPPVGEREAFGYFYIVNRVHEGFCKGVEPPPDDSYDEGTLVPVYRSALSAGDAVDGPLIDAGSKPALSPLSDKEAIALIEEHTNDDNVLHAHEAIELIRSVERAHGIDAAMRKGPL